MKSSVINKKVETIEVELDVDDLDFIITEHFKRMYNATTSEVIVDLSELHHLSNRDCIIHMTYHREELIK